MVTQKDIIYERGTVKKKANMVDVLSIRMNIEFLNWLKPP
jgi:hypothetical protein